PTVTRTGLDACPARRSALLFSSRHGRILHGAHRHFDRLFFDQVSPRKYAGRSYPESGAPHSPGDCVDGSSIRDFDGDFRLGSGRNELPAIAGKRLFEELRCASCHQPDVGLARCPPVVGIFGRGVKLADGATVTADEDYLRESILRPSAKVVAGFQPLMPSFDGQVDEEQLIQLIAYIKSLTTP